MAHVIDVRDVKHEQLGDDDVDEVQLRSVVDSHGHGIQDAADSSETGPQSRLSLSSVSAMLGTGKRTRLIATIVTLLTVVAVSVGVVLSRGGTSGSTTVENTSTGVIPTTPQASDPTPFLKLSFEGDGNTVFVLNKAHWNASFMVYPTVVKHSAPPHEGMERGSVLLDTNHYVFHFEKSVDERFLLLVCENHLARLSHDDDELKQAFDDSQWPGYFARIAIYSEADDAIHFPPDAFFAHGFFVSATLMSPHYTAIPGGSSSFPRNANFEIEYELDSGILRVNYAVGLLPETLMPQRVADDRIGYFMQRYIRFGVDNEDPKNATADGVQYMGAPMTVINRRRLELDPQTGKTLEPIVYYIDPSVPARWRQAFADGVAAWAPAFEAIGFKDAIKAVMPEDADWPTDYRLGDLRYNSISVMISDMTYAFGPMVYDPRSGEIIHSDITFEYGFFDEVVADFDLRSPVDPPSSGASASLNASRSMRHTPRQCGIGRSPHHQLDRMVAGMLLSTRMGVIPHAVISRHFTDIVMHEVGHTLGLRHNFAGSALVTRQHLSNHAFTSVEGVSASIMDYVPVNVFSDLTPAAAKTHDFYQSAIGSYDKAAIAYGYSIIRGEEPGYKHAKLSTLAQAAPLFLTDEDAETSTNPYAQWFDLSTDPIDYANDRLELVKTFRNDALLVNKIAEDASWANLWRYEQMMLRLVNRTIQMLHPFLGGVNATHAHRQRGETSFSVPFIPRETQLRALRVLGRIIGADDGVFPSPSQYASLIQIQGYEDEDCTLPSNDYGCLARGLVNVDKVIRSIREHAIRATLFPALDRIIAQDVNCPIAVVDVLSAVENAASRGPHEPRNQVVYTYFRDGLRSLMKDEHEDARLRREVFAFLNATAAH